MLPGLTSAIVGSRSASISYVTRSAVNIGSVATTRTFSGVSLGAANSSRRIILGINFLASSTDGGAPSDSITAVTVGGAAATKLAEASSGSVSGVRSYIYGVDNASDTTADIVITGRFTALCVAVYNLERDSGFTPDSTDVDEPGGTDQTASVTLSGNCGLMVASALNENIDGAWSGATEDYEQDILTGEIFTAARVNNSGSPFTVSRTKIDTLAAAAWF